MAVVLSARSLRTGDCENLLVLPVSMPSCGEVGSISVLGAEAAAKRCQIRLCRCQQCRQAATSCLGRLPFPSGGRRPSGGSELSSALIPDRPIPGRLGSGAGRPDGGSSAALRAAKAAKPGATPTAPTAGAAAWAGSARGMCPLSPPAWQERSTDASTGALGSSRTPIWWASTVRGGGECVPSPLSVASTRAVQSMPHQLRHSASRPKSSSLSGRSCSGATLRVADS